MKRLQCEFGLFRSSERCGREQGDNVSVRSLDHSLHFIVTNPTASHIYDEMR